MANWEAVSKARILLSGTVLRMEDAKEASELVQLHLQWMN